VRRTTIRIPSSEGPEFDCHVAMPETGPAIPAVVLASSIYGVDEDLRGIADEFASSGCIAVAPDLFWRTLPGPLARGDARATLRAQRRLDCIRTGERDFVDVMRMLAGQPLFNGRAALIGLCYGGPYAIVGPKRLGFEAGMSCHGSQMLDFVTDLQDVERPIFIEWGDHDDAAPAAVRDAYRAAAAQMQNVKLRVFPGAAHGYMMRGNTGAFDEALYEQTIERALAMVQALREDGQSRAAAQ
jgi:carboxymethylenebutenolidase